jgi:hypothetical protein
MATLAVAYLRPVGVSRNARFELLDLLLTENYGQHTTEQAKGRPWCARKLGFPNLTC